MPDQHSEMYIFDQYCRSTRKAHFSWTPKSHYSLVMFQSLQDIVQNNEMYLNKWKVNQKQNK